MLASVNGFVSWSAVVALLAVLPAASSAQEERARRVGEDRRVPSLAVIGGLAIRVQESNASDAAFGARPAGGDRAGARFHPTPCRIWG